jgi:hypothetical protein
MKRNLNNINSMKFGMIKLKTMVKKKIIQIEEKQAQIKEEEKKFREWWIKEE